MSVHYIQSDTDFTKFVKSAKGKFFSVTFVKRSDGSVQKFTARTGVKKHVTGVGMAYDPKKHDLMTVFVPSKVNPAKNDKGYRTIPIDGITSIQIGETTLKRKASTKKKP